MERDEVWQAIDAQRVRLTDMLDRLTEEEWRHPSLCQGWTVRDVAGHLTFAQARMYEFVPGLIRARGNLNRANLEDGIRRAALPTHELVATIRAMVGSQRHIQGITHNETLVDILMHSQDIAVPLGRPFALDTRAAAHAATSVWTKTLGFWRPRKEFDGFQLTATDVDWSVGAGTKVSGPIDAILLLITGRREAALPRLAGLETSAQSGL